MEIVDFKAQHLTHITENGMVDVKLKPWLLPSHGEAIEKFGGAYTVLENGQPIAVGGVVTYWNNRGEAWLIFGKTNPQTFVVIFNMVSRFLSECNLKRIEMVVDYAFEQGHRWARLLGFKKECDLLKCYRPDGGDVTSYVMIKENNINATPSGGIQ